MLKSSLVAFATALFATCLFACEDDHHHYGDDYPSPYYPGPSTGSSGTGGSSGSSGSTTDPGSTPSSTPMLVVVDTNQVMNADPGLGVGIFTEYTAGGGWHVWWTCDTTTSGLPCDVTLTATAESGALTGLDTGELLQAGTATQPDETSVNVSVTTTTEVHGIKFTTDPGAIMQLTATIGGLSDGPGPNRSFYFFVQDGKINGGYTGVLTNPLQFQGNTP